MKRKKLTCILVSVILGVVLIFGCGISQAEEKIKLTMWFPWNPIRDQIEIIAKEFEKNHPNVEVETMQMSLVALTQKIKTALAAGKGPDLVSSGNAESAMGPQVRAGLILNLDSYDEKYGWRKNLYSEGVYRTITYANDGTLLGQGHLYGMSPCGEFVGVFYNKDTFKKIGITIPKTLEELESSLAKIKASGNIPIMLGNLGRWPIQHVFGPLQHVLTWHESRSRNLLDEFFTQTCGYQAENYKNIFDTYTEAGRIIQEWVKEEYFVKGFAGLDYSSSVKLFASGKGGMYMGGTWLTGDFITNEDIGIFPFPSIREEEGIPLHVGSSFSPVAIAKTSKHPDLAAEFLNFVIASDFAQNLMVEAGMLPSRVPAILEGKNISPLYQEQVDIWNRLNEENKLGYYTGYEGPTFGETIYSATQELAGLKITPEQFRRILMDDYQKWLYELEELRGE